MSAPIVIIGGGITGLAAAAWLEQDHAAGDCVVLDSERRAGGKIRSERRHGHLLEWGPQGFLDNSPDTLTLAAAVGLEAAVVTADEASADRFILRRNILRSVPTKPPAFLTSDILPLGAKLRVFCEPFARSRPDRDETVFDFAARRIGPTAARVLVDAMVTGVFAGDSTQLSLAATFPKMAKMEADHGSLTKALIAAMRTARKAGKTSGGPAGPSGTLCTFAEGMAQLPLRLAERLGARYRPGVTATRLERRDDGWIVHTDAGQVVASRVLLTTPAAVSAGLVADLAPAASVALAGIGTVPITVVMASYTDPSAFGRPLNGFGFLVPRDEQLGILGTLFCHAIFPGQAPAGTLFLRTMLGGAREPAACALDDAATVARTRAALARVYGHDPEPSEVWVVRWAEGISQYTVGHLDRVGTVEGALRPLGLDVAGSPYRGVSVNDCIRQARAAAARLVAS